MTNEEKANEIAREMLPYNNAEYHACYNSAMKAMKWKDEQHAKEKQQWIDVSNELPPFVTMEDGNKYSSQVFCKEKCGSYCVARFVRWHTGHYMWLDSANEQLNVKFWREIKD